MDKEFEEIGELLFKVIDYIKADNRKKSEIQKVDDSHYLERLMRKTSEGIRVYWELKEKIKAHPLIKKGVSEGIIDAELRTMLWIIENRKKIRNLEPEKAGQKIINSLLELRTSYLVIFILEGFFPGSKILKIGNVTFGIYQKILENYEIPKFQHPKPGEKHFPDRKYIFNNISNEESKYFDMVCVGTVVNACDKKAAVFLARQQINLSLNIIRLLISLDYDLFRRPNISISGVSCVHKAFVISVEDGERYFPVFDDLELSGIYSLFGYKYKTDKSIKKANEVASKDSDKRTELEERIVSSINWIGDGINTDEKDLKVVKCVIGLEVLFKIGRKGKRKGFIDGVTSLFDSYIRNKNLIKKYAEEIYELRCDIVHEGKRNITDEKAEMAEHLSCGCILRFLEKMDDS